MALHLENHRAAPGTVIFSPSFDFRILASLLKVIGNQKMLFPNSLSNIKEEVENESIGITDLE